MTIILPFKGEILPPNKMVQITRLSFGNDSTSTINYNDSTLLDSDGNIRLWLIPANTFVEAVGFQVKTGFTSGGSVAIGDISDRDGFFAIPDSDIISTDAVPVWTSGERAYSGGKLYTSEDYITAYIAHGATITSGTADIYLKYALNVGADT